MSMRRKGYAPPLASFGFILTQRKEGQGCGSSYLINRLLNNLSNNEIADIRNSGWIF